jgi:hypothetical protein
MKKQFLVAVLLFAVVAGAFFALRNKSKENIETVVQPSPSPAASSFRGIVPGTSLDADVIAVLGKPIRKDTAGDQASSLIYASGIEKRPLNIDVGASGVVARIIEPFSSTSQFSRMSVGLGGPDLTLFGLFEKQGFRLFVYLTRGIALLANPTTDALKERWYFQPTSPDDFLRNIAPGLTTQNTEGQQ